MKRKPVTRKNAVDCLLKRFADLGFELTCAICKLSLKAGEDIEFDHIHAVVFDGPHEYENLRPLHRECHKVKSRNDVKGLAKVKRLENGGKSTKLVVRMKSKPFPKVKRQFPKRPFNASKSQRTPFRKNP